MQIITCTEEHKDRLTEMWLISVHRTLYDLDPGDIEGYVHLFQENIVDKMELHGVRSRFGGELTGFIAMNGPKVELLVVHPHYQGQGISDMLLEYVAKRGELVVDVTEQAPDVYDYYQRLGFIEAGRSGTTLHLIRPSLLEQTGA